MFNPPGVNAHDKDPAADIPCNPDDFFDFEDEEDGNNVDDLFVGTSLMEN